VQFITVYIVEAHASDQWPLGKSCSIPQHKTLADRKAAAQKLIKDWHYELPMYLDPMDNNLQKAFGAWPERMVIVDGARTVKWISVADEEGSTVGWNDQMEATFSALTRT